MLLLRCTRYLWYAAPGITDGDNTQATRTCGERVLCCFAKRITLCIINVLGLAVPVYHEDVGSRETCQARQNMRCQKGVGQKCSTLKPSSLVSVTAYQEAKLLSVKG